MAASKKYSYHLTQLVLVKRVRETFMLENVCDI